MTEKRTICPFSYVIYGHMNNFFRKDWNGFHDWMRFINRMRWTISSYKKGAKLEDGEYTEANLWYTNYLEFMIKLKEK